MAIRAAAAVAGLSAAARRASSCLHHSAPSRSALRRRSVGDETTTPTAAAVTRRRPLLPHAPSSGPHVLRRRGLAVFPGEGDDHSPGADAEAVSTDPFDPDDPEAPDDPETCFAYDEKDVESEEAMWAMYERWRVFHGVRRDRDDMLRRFAGFKDRARAILEFNKSGKSWTQGLNRFGDRTPEEISRMFPPKLWRPIADRCCCSVCCRSGNEINVKLVCQDGKMNGLLQA